MKATIDLNELQDSLKVPDAFDAHPDVDSIDMSERLPAGDIELLGVGFERKTISDYVASMEDGRIDEQVVKLSQVYDESYILVEGDLAGTENMFSGMSGTSIRGSMASVTARDNGVNAVIPCSTIELLADMATRLARKHVEESDKKYLPTHDLQDNDAPVEMKMYACIDGVGPETAESLYEKYPVPAFLCKMSSVEKLTEIDGIGEKTAKKVLVAFRG